MRALHALPLAAAMFLAACGDNNADADGDGKLSGEEVAEEAGDLVQPRPGQYRSTVEVLEFDAPGMPEGAKQQMEQIFASGMQGSTFCMTEADTAKNGPEQMVKNLAQSNCEMKNFNVSGGTVVAEMQCPSQGGGASTVKMEGQMSAEGSTMTMDMKQDMPQLGSVNMKMRVTSERIGDCAG